MNVINATKLRRSICQKSFYEFFKYFWTTIVADELLLNWHIQYLCNELQLVAERVFAGELKLYDLVINISPGSSKSTIISQAFPAWCWTRMPSLRYIGGSYSYSLAMRDNIACRDIIQSDKFQALFPEIQLREDQNTKGLFVNNFKGSRLAVSVGSMVTGQHGHILGVDDPIDPESALSEVDMKKVNRWMTNTLPSRGIARTDTPMILVQQRLAQNDPSGERLARGGRVKHICIPAELLYDKDGALSVNVQPKGLIKYYRNKLMDPRRLSRKNLDEFRKVLGEYGYAGQYLQDPVPLSGAMFDITQLAIAEAAPARFVRLVRGWDKAACLIAGTAITTARGNIPIESVIVGDLVPTRNGLQRVEKAWMSKRVNELCSVIFSNGSILTGTPDHPIACENEWIELQNLQPNNIICHINESTSLKKSEFLMEQNILDTRLEKAEVKEGISSMFLDRKPCIEFSGSQSMGVFPVAAVSIIKMETGIITKSVIWNVEPNHLIKSCISIVRNSERRCVSGIAIQRIVKSCLMDGVKLFKSQSILSATSVEMSLSLGVSKPNIARIAHVETKPMFKVNGGVPVYDLQVRNCPEFYANGILVHNTKDAGAFSAGVLLGEDKFGDYWVLDVVRGQWNPTDRERMLKQTVQLDASGAHGKLIGGGNVVRVEQIVEKEGGSGGVESTNNTIKNLAGFHVIGKRVTGDKESRAYAFASQVGVQGHVHVLNRHWTKEYIEELRFFPHSKYKDQVDASSLAFNRMARTKKIVGGGVLSRK